MPLVEVVERDVELIDAGVPQRLRALRREHGAVRDQRDVLERDRAIDLGDEILEIAAQRRLAAGEGDEHRIEEARRVGVALELRRALVGVGLPVVTEPAVRVAAKRDLEVHEHRPTTRREPRVLSEKERDVPGLEARRKHRQS